jgi:hypothetical protein
MKAQVKSRIAHTKFDLAQAKTVFAQAKSPIAQANAQLILVQPWLRPGKRCVISRL